MASAQKPARPTLDAPQASFLARGSASLRRAGARWLRRLVSDAGLHRASPLWLILLPLVLVYASLLLVAQVTAGRMPLPVEAFVVNAAAATAALGVVVASRRWLGARRSLHGYGVALDRRRLVEFLTGAGLGLGAVAITFLVGLAGGWLQVVDVLDRGVMALWSGIGLIVLANICVGLWEELMLRGVFLRTAADGLGRWLRPRAALAGGVALSATVFGLAHAGQPDRPAFVATWVLAGVVFAVIAIRSNSLALPIGAHAAFNIAYQAIFVRTDLEGMAAVSALLRVDVDPDIPALGFGGILEASAFVCLGLVTLAYLRTRMAGRA